MSKMYHNSDMGCGGLIIAFLVALVLILIWPIFGYFVGWISAHLCTFFSGDMVPNALNTLFNSTHFTVENLPTCLVLLVPLVVSLRVLALVATIKEEL